MRADDVARRRRPCAAALACALLLATPADAQPAAAAGAADEPPEIALKRRHSPVHPQLARRAAEARTRGAGPAAAAIAGDAWPEILRDGGIVIDAASTGDPRALLAELEALGLTGGSVSGNAVSGLLPLAAVDALESCGSLAVARPALATPQRGLDRGRGRHGPAPPRADTGAVVSQGVAAMRVDRLPPRVDGAGTGVGILSDSFDCLGGGGGLADDVASGDLPPEVTLLDDPDTISCLDEGRAMAQLVHDVAPGSRLGFHTAFGGQADFAQGIGELARDFGADVIVDDVLYFTEPWFQDGPIARAAEAVHEQGVAYFSAAGNAARRSYEAPFRDSGQTGFYQSVGETRRHDFDPGPGVDVFQTLTLPPSTSIVLVLQWAEPFVSASTADPPVGAASDYDLLVYRREDPAPLDFSQVVARSTAFNPGGDAVEALQISNPGPQPLEVYAAVERFILPGIDGPDVERMKLIAYGAVDMEWSTAGPTSVGHANAEGAIAVGAAAWYETPAFGVSPPLLEPFSSAGGVPILFDATSERLPEPVVRETPDLVAPDGVNTTFFFPTSDIPEDDDTFPNFFGTSAAAPHAAAVAALLQSEARGGAAVTDEGGALRALRMCVTWRLGPFLRLPLTVPVPPEHVPDALDAGATLGPCWKLSPDRIEHLLEATAVDMADPGYDRESGHGLVDARRAWRVLPWFLRGPSWGAPGRR